MRQSLNPRRYAHAHQCLNPIHQKIDRIALPVSLKRIYPFAQQSCLVIQGGAHPRLYFFVYAIC